MFFAKGAPLSELKVRIGAVFDPQSEKWFLIFKVLALNAVVMSLLMFAMYMLGRVEGIEQFKENKALAGYFNDFSLFNFWIFFKKHCIEGPASEEILRRAPVYLLTLINLEVLVKDRNFAKCVLWISLIIPTGFWALSHTFALPVFIAGLAYGWLIIKTRSMWPAIVCHSLSNLSIYILLKILQYLEYAPFN